MTMAERKSIEDYTFNISLKMMAIVAVFMIGSIWKGASWYHGIIEGQSKATFEIISKIDSIGRKQDVKDINQDNNIRELQAEDKRINERINAINLKLSKK